LDAEFAATTEFKRPVAHGMLALALIGETLAQVFGGSWLRGGTLRARFKGPVYAGEEVTVHGQVTKEVPDAERSRVECSMAVRNSQGEDVVTATATVPLPSEKR
jgi:acyl dehydratase